MVSSHHDSNHFEGHDPLTHVTEKQAEGIVSSAEIHGTEVPGHLSAGADAARETAVVLLLFWTLLYRFELPILSLFLVFSVGWMLWKMGRSAWLGWSRLERLHRILEEEKWEIEHNRAQEKEELKVLYAAKGFEGKLLDDVIDVLMADNERALHVMLKEELGLKLEENEHPLKQSLGALTGTAIASCICLIGLLTPVSLGIVFAAFLTIAAAAALSAKYEKNRVINAVVWNLGLAALSFGSVYFLIDYIK